MRHQPQYIIIADLNSLRYESYHDTLVRFWRTYGQEPIVQTVSWLDLIANDGDISGLVDVVSDCPWRLRIDSPSRGDNVLRALLFAGDRACGTAEFEFDNLDWPIGQLVSPLHAYRGLRHTLLGLSESLRSIEEVDLSATPSAIVEMFDKNAAAKRLEKNGLPVPRYVNFDITPSATSTQISAALIREIRDSGLSSVFVKLNHGHSGSGIVKLTMNKGWTGISTVAEQDGSFFNVANTIGLQGERLHRTLAFIVRNRCCVQSSVEKAEVHGEGFDLRVIVIHGQVEFTIFRSSNTPFTNLHLGGSRGDWNTFRKSVPDRQWIDAMESCVRAAKLYDSDMVGVDLVFERKFYDHFILELNAFGDFFPGWTNEKSETIYEVEIRETARKLGWFRD